MSPRARASLAAVGVVVVGGVGYLVSLDTERQGPPVEVQARILGPTRRVHLDDGGKQYVVEVETGDGGREWRETMPPGCVRRPAGAPVASCMRRTEDGGARDFGELNRFQASDAVGAGCRPVACSVVAGEDAEAEE